MRKGQYSAVFKLVQGAVFASIFLVIIWGALSWLESMKPRTGVAKISVDVLKSAYASTDTDQSFSRTAWIKEEFFSANSIRKRAGLPDSAQVEIYCSRSFCPDACETGCDKILLDEGDKTQVCAACESTPAVCRLYIGESECSPLLW